MPRQSQFAIPNARCAAGGLLAAGASCLCASRSALCAIIVSLTVFFSRSVFAYFSFFSCRTLTWIIPSIGSDNKSGTLEFSVPELDSDAFFPLQVTFEAKETLSQISITAVQQAEGEGADVMFAADTQVSVESYTVE